MRHRTTFSKLMVESERSVLYFIYWWTIEERTPG